MTMQDYNRRSPMPTSAAGLFEWHARPGALERLLPPWLGVKVLEQTGGIEAGARVRVSVPVGPFRARMTARHIACVAGEMFQDVQESGPFSFWEHTHRFEPTGEDSSILNDSIRYALPAGAVGRVVAGARMRRDLERMFRFRHERTRDDLRAHLRHAGGGPRSILISGASGLVGRELRAFLTTGGHDVVPLIRSKRDAGGVRWSPEDGTLEVAKLDGFDTIVHLAGESIMGRWTADKKRKILESRVRGTRLIAETLAGIPNQSGSGRPRTLIAASAIGIYGDRGSEELTEDSFAGDGFLAEVCRAWEAACEPARQAGIRVVNVRIGLVLSPQGSVLGTILPMFKAGLGGRIGRGDQWMSWIAIDDLVDILHTAIFDDSLHGAVNAAAPRPVTNAEFTRTLGRVLGRPTIATVPKFALRAALGEAADETALSSARVLPRRLMNLGHPFRFTELEAALRFLLGR